MQLLTCLVRVVMCGVVVCADLWSWADLWLQVPVVSFVYSRWRPFFGNRSSQTILAHAEKKGDQWVPRARAAAASQYHLPPIDSVAGGAAESEDDNSYDASRPLYVPNNGVSVTQRSSSQSR